MENTGYKGRGGLGAFGSLSLRFYLKMGNSSKKMNKYVFFSLSSRI